MSSPLPRRVLLAACLAAALPAQPVARDGWLVATSPDITTKLGGGLYLLSPDFKSFTPLQNQSASLLEANCVAVDPRTGFVYVGTSNKTLGGGQILQVFIAGTTVVREVQVTASSPDGGYISGLALREGEVWYVTSGSGATKGAVGYVPKAGGTPVNVYILNPPVVNGLGNAIATDGRELFIGTSYNAQDQYRLWALDPTAPQPALRGLAAPSGSSYPTQMGLTAEGKILSFDNGGGALVVDPATGGATPFTGGLRPPQGSINGGIFNPWVDLAVIIPAYGSTPREVHAWDNLAKAWTAQAIATFSGVPTGVAANFVDPFFRFGQGCPGAGAKEPRPGATGLSTLGNAAFALTLRDGDPITPAVLLLGATRSSWAGLPLPFDLTPLGAPGCAIRVAPLAGLPAPLTTSLGDASVPLPIPGQPVLAGADLFVQWLLLGPANPLGAVTSEGIALHLR